MILSIADIHLGHKLYSSILDNGLTTAEEDTRAALDKVYERASALDIEMIICAGDFFHVSKPSSENIRWAITWVKKMDSLGKPVYIIPGNHDVSAYWNSLVFLKSLYVRNVVLVDQDILKIDWVRGPIYFVPFLSPESTKNKYATTLEALNSLSTIIDPTDKNIIVTHIQEAASKISSESTMISRGIETINMDYFSKVPCTDTILLSGHMHMHQIYTKNGITIVYPGSLTYTESTDCGQKKGYVLIDHDGTIKFEEIQGVRKYKQYILPK
jgi:DNA repair exonuclease SbcCD nuclease subunit